MSISRSTFCDRIATVRASVVDFRLSDRPAIPSNESHNKSVRVIRNGLAVQCFNIFEDYVRGRIAEILNYMCSASIPFASLPADLRKAATVDVIRALQFQMKLQDTSNLISFVQDYCEKVSSTKSGPLQLADLAFFHSSSNVSTDQYGSALSAFAIEQPWRQVEGISSRVGLSGLPAKEVFQAFALRRHEAAHEPGASISETDLHQSLNDATSLAIGFDVLATISSRILINSWRAGLPNAPAINTHMSIPLRFIKYLNGRFGEIKENGRKVIKSRANYAVLVPAAAKHAAKENGALIVYDKNGVIVQWAV